MGIEYRQGGRRVSSAKFFEGVRKKGIEAALATMTKKYQGLAASIVDPATGRHAEVFVRRSGEASLAISTSGSPDYARELERRLGLREGEVSNTGDTSADIRPRVYLAHASEDHESLAKPLAERLMAAGIDVWLDGWEIRPGDSLRQKMEQGLADSTHFMVLLTPRSIGKAWVEREIDAGFLRAVNGESRFVGLRIGVAVRDLSTFLQTVRCPDLDPDDDAAVEVIVADLYGVSRKPSLGEAPRYVRRQEDGLPGWSAAAATIAEHLVRVSEFGLPMDPEMTLAQLTDATGLPAREVKLGVLDLVDAGLLERDEVIGSNAIWPTAALFVEFDRYFMGFNNRTDAIAIANLLVSEDVEEIEIDDLAGRLPDWSARRINSALSYLEGLNAIEAQRYYGADQWAMSEVGVTDRTLRFVRDNT